MRSEHPPLAISMGEPAGIGPDLVLQLYARKAEIGLPPFIVHGHMGFLRKRAERLGLDMLFTESAPEDASETFARALPIAHIEGEVADRPGDPQADAAKVVIEAITRATADVREGTCRALVTAPIHKAALYAAGFGFPGHTEFLAVLSARGGEAATPVMMLVHEDLRAVPLTIHVPLAEVPLLVTEDLIVETSQIVAGELRDKFGIAEPKLAIAGLNPHAGEDGTIGVEDRDVIVPAVAVLRAAGIAAEGPLSADTLFYPPHWRQYDAVIAMYHDQALIPIKTVGFDSGVNVTLGLPIIRTSPDHGTAFALAGTGQASTSSMLAAIRLADKMSAGQKTS